MVPLMLSKCSGQWWLLISNLIVCMGSCMSCAWYVTRYHKAEASCVIVSERSCVNSVSAALSLLMRAPA